MKSCCYVREFPGVCAHGGSLRPMRCTCSPFHFQFNPRHVAMVPVVCMFVVSPVHVLCCSSMDGHGQIGFLITHIAFFPLPDNNPPHTHAPYTCIHPHAKSHHMHFHTTHTIHMDNPTPTTHYTTSPIYTVHTYTHAYPLRIQPTEVQTEHSQHSYYTRELQPSLHEHCRSP